MLWPFLLGIICLFLPGMIIGFLVFKFTHIKNENLKYILCFATLALLFFILTQLWKGFAYTENIAFGIILSLIGIPVGRDLAKKLKKKTKDI